MESSRFDDLIRSLAGSRRSLVSGSLALAPSWFGISAANAKRKRKHKKRKKKSRPNEFGCLEIGDPCQNAEQCCSGICEGKQGKKRCQSHGAGTCEQGGPDVCAVNTPAVFCNNASSCVCVRTTADSNFCGIVVPPSDCANCRTDADCEALGFPRGSACAPWASGHCAELCETGMLCLAPCGTELPGPAG